jgi:Stabilization of polarity axis
MLSEFTPPPSLTSLDDSDILFCLNVVRTKKDETARRGAYVKAMAVVTPHRFFHVFKPILLLALDRYFDNQSIDVLESVFDSINAMDLTDFTHLQGVDMRVWRASRLRVMNQTRESDLMFSTSLTFEPPPPASSTASGTVSGTVSGTASGTASSTNTTTSLKLQVPVRIAIGMESDEVGETSLVSLVSMFGENLLHVFNALLAQKRILFLGHNEPASRVCQCVLSACMLVAPPLTGTLRRAFPYSNLIDLSFLQVEGYIAGVTNPIFEQRQEWWDVLCNVTSGQVVLSSSYRNILDERDTYVLQSELDNEFIQKVISGVSLKYGEEWTRCMFRDYAQHIISIAFDEEMFQDSSTRDRHIAANVYRVNDFRKATHQYESYITQCAKEAKESSFSVSCSNDGVATATLAPVNSSLVKRAVRSLQVCKQGDDAMIGLFQTLVHHCNSQMQLRELLSLLPESQGGLFPIAIGLFHQSSIVRESAVILLTRLDELKEGASAVASLNYYLLLTYYRFARDLNQRLDDAADGVASDATGTSHHGHDDTDDILSDEDDIVQSDSLYDTSITATSHLDVYGRDTDADADVDVDADADTASIATTARPQSPHRDPPHRPGVSSSSRNTAGSPDSDEWIDANTTTKLAAADSKRSRAPPQRKLAAPSKDTSATSKPRNVFERLASQPTQSTRNRNTGIKRSPSAHSNASSHASRK